MPTMTKNATTGKYELNITPSTSAQTETLNTSGKYCDADIDVKVSAVATGTINVGTIGSISFTPTVETNMAIISNPSGTNGTNYFTITASGITNGTIQGVAAVPSGEDGYVSSGTYMGPNPQSGSITGNSVLHVAAATYGTSNSGTLVKTITPNTSSDQYVNVTAGYTQASKIKVSSVSFGGYNVNASRTTISNTSNINIYRDMAAIVCDSGGTYVFYYQGSQVTSVTLAPGAIIYNDGSAWKYLNVGSSSATTITSGTSFLGIRKSSSSGTYRIRIISSPVLA